MSFLSNTTWREAVGCPDDDRVRVSFRLGQGFEVQEGTGAPRPVSLKELVAHVHSVESDAQAAEAEGNARSADHRRAVAARLRRDAHWQCAIARQYQINLACRSVNGRSERA